MENAKVRKPDWLNKKIDLKKMGNIEHLLKGLKLNTICREAGCPNISECYCQGVATFLIMGNICTRDCSFCGVKKGKPLPLDIDEPFRVSRAIKRLKLKHVVITSVTRDDMPDGGAGFFCACIDTIRTYSPSVKIEVLVPDFQGDRGSVVKVVNAKPDIFAHNLETVPGAYKKVRQKADYKRSLEVLYMAKESSAEVKTKSGIMLGLGETKKEVLETFGDLRYVKCDFLSIGQYLQPGKRNFPVQEYIVPYEFEDYKKEALKLGFKHVESGPYVRSSYIANNYLCGC